MEKNTSALITALKLFNKTVRQASFTAFRTVFKK